MDRTRKPAAQPPEAQEQRMEGESMDWDAAVARLEKMLDDMEDA